jgi:predicted membrane channel-forming protein YqfA (hemolysin III family)
MTEFLPLLAIASVPVVAGLRSCMKPLVVLLCAWSVVIQLAGAFFYPASDWHGRMGDIEAHAWDWRHFMPWEDYLAWREKRQASR